MSELTLADLGHTSEQSSMLPAEHAQMLAATLDVAFDSILTFRCCGTGHTSTPSLGQPGWDPTVIPDESPLLVDFPRRMWVGRRDPGRRFSTD